MDKEELIKKLTKARDMYAGLECNKHIEAQFIHAEVVLTMVLSNSYMLDHPTNIDRVYEALQLVADETLLNYVEEYGNWLEKEVKYMRIKEEKDKEENE